MTSSGTGAQRAERQLPRPPKLDADGSRYTNKKIIGTDSVSLARHARKRRTQG